MATIEHFVVLMLENRSFDSMLGTLAGKFPGLDGLSADATNNIGATVYKAGAAVAGQPEFTVPTPDPGESFDDINTQIFGSKTGRAEKLPPTMSGFAANYAEQTPSDPSESYHPAAVMYAYTGDQVPVLQTLATAFGVSDRWFASAPCQTWPNRFFAHAGTCHGVVDNDMFLGAGQVPFPGPNIFTRLEAANLPWQVYFHDIPQSILLEGVPALAVERYRPFQQFRADAAVGTLPAYSFIEPRYFANIATGNPPNDQHPPHDVRYAEQLVYDVYTALRASPQWEKTLLLITYDEHGGCYDHVPPPVCVSPDGKADPASGFAFDTLGVRVPAVIVSPWIAPRSLVRPADPDGPPFDHTSIIKTLRDIFPAIGAALTERDKAAPSLLPFLSLDRPTNGGPDNLLNPNAQADRTLLQEIGSAVANDFQAALGSALSFLATNRMPSPTDERSSVAVTAMKAGVNLNQTMGTWSPPG